MTKTHLALRRHFKVKSINDPVTMLDSRLVLKRLRKVKPYYELGGKVVPKPKLRWTQERIRFWMFWIAVYDVIGFWIVEYWFRK